MCWKILKDLYNEIKLVFKRLELQMYKYAKLA